MNNEWQPIETAPKDGKVILLYAITDNMDGEAKNWKTATGHWWNGYDAADSCWIWDGFYINRPYDHQPTHWMPLPLPPATRPQVRG